MKIVLINPNCASAKGINKATIEPPLGIGYLASYLIRERFEVRLIDANILNLTGEEILKIIDPDTRIVGISFNVVSAISAFGLFKYLKTKLPGCMFIAGGPHPSSIPDICLEEIGFDAVCIGEGEKTLLEAARNMDSGRPDPFEGVDGIFYKRQKNIIRNRPRELIDDLDTVPIIDLSLFPALSLYKSRARQTGRRNIDQQGMPVPVRLLQQKHIPPEIQA